MHVFCPDCNAEYKVNERSSLTKTVKFVCIECGSSWVDKFEKLEKTKSLETDSVASKSDGVVENTSAEAGKMELNSLALEEVQNSFGNLTNRIDSKNNTAVIEHEASTSKINEDQLYYCRQRGLSHEEAVSLIVNGFCKQVLQELPMEFAVEAQKLVSISLEGSVG